MKRKASDVIASETSKTVDTRVYYSTAMRPPPPSSAASRMMSWNVNGIRAVLKKDPLAFKKLAAENELDFLCLQ
jgi:exodeoxyribonuclease-3